MKLDLYTMIPFMPITSFEILIGNVGPHSAYTALQR
jgi:hypothetical protein